MSSKSEERTWDRVFRRNIQRADERGTDLNDELNKEWPGGEEWADTYILPHVRPGATVVEIGPGTGRITRYVRPKAGAYIFADYSQFVCDFLKKEYPGDQIVHVVDCQLAGVADNSVDVLFSISVFGHLFEEQVYAYMLEAKRVLKKDGVLALHMIDLRGEFDLFKSNMPSRPDKQRCAFRFLHPEYATLMATNAGFSKTASEVMAGRAYMLTAKA